MTFVDYLKNQLALARIRRALKAERHLNWELAEQVNAGGLALRVSNAKIAQLEAELLAIKPPDEIVRRSGAGA